jgi:hypothetical protein
MVKEEEEDDDEGGREGNLTENCLPEYLFFAHIFNSRTGYISLFQH